MSRPLFAIAGDLVALDQLLDDVGGEITAPEVEAAITQWFAELETERAAKLDSYYHFIRQNEMEAAAAAAEEEQWAKRKQVKKNIAASMKARIKVYMEETGIKKMVSKTGYVFAIQANGGVEPMVLVEDKIKFDELPPQFVKVVKSLDAAAVRAALDAGEKLVFASIGERGTHLRMRI